MLDPVGHELRPKVFSIGQLEQPRRSPGRLRRPRTRGLALSILRTPSNRIFFNFRIFVLDHKV